MEILGFTHHCSGSSGSNSRLGFLVQYSPGNLFSHRSPKTHMDVDQWSQHVSFFIVICSYVYNILPVYCNIKKKQIQTVDKFIINL